MHQRGKWHIYFSNRESDWFCFLGTKEIKLTWIHSKVMACWGESRWTETHGTGCQASNKGLKTNTHSLLQKNIVSTAHNVYVLSLLLLNQLSLGVYAFIQTIQILCEVMATILTQSPPLHYIQQAKLIRVHYSSLQDHQHHNGAWLPKTHILLIFFTTHMTLTLYFLRIGSLLIKMQLKASVCVTLKPPPSTSELVLFKHTEAFSARDCCGWSGTKRRWLLSRLLPPVNVA